MEGTGSAEDGESEEGSYGDDDTVDQESDTTVVDDEYEHPTVDASESSGTTQSHRGALPHVAAIVMPAAPDAGASQSSLATAAVRPARLPIPQPATAAIARALVAAQAATQVPPSVSSTPCLVEEIDSEEDDPDLAAALAASLQ